MKQLLITITALVLVGCKPSVPDISIHDAAEEGNIEAVKQHIAAGTDVNAKDGGWTPLHQAAYKGHKEIAELLIEKGAGVDAKTDDGLTPLRLTILHFATTKEMVELLITNGADVNAMTDDGKTPLDWANGLLRLAKMEPVKEERIAAVNLLRKHGAKTAEELKAEEK